MVKVGASALGPLAQGCNPAQTISWLQEKTVGPSRVSTPGCHSTLLPDGRTPGLRDGPSQPSNRHEGLRNMWHLLRSETLLRCWI